MKKKIHHHILFFILFGIIFSLFSLNTYANNNAVNPANSGTALPDLFTGAMSYSVPIQVPPGRKGMQPSLALTYNSNNRNGWLGVGWELEVGSIERSTKRGVDYTGDSYILRMAGAGIDLVNVATGTDQNEYRPKIESSFAKTRLFGIIGEKKIEKQVARKREKGDVQIIRYFSKV